MLCEVPVSLFSPEAQQSHREHGHQDGVDPVGSPRENSDEGLFARVADLVLPCARPIARAPSLAFI